MTGHNGQWEGEARLADGRTRCALYAKVKRGGESEGMGEVQRRRGLGFAACALASGFWGCGFFLGKIALGEMRPDFMVLYRFLFAMAPLVPVMVRHRPSFSRRDWGLLGVAALFGVPVQFLVQFYGLSLTTVSHASLMVGTMPVILALGATVFAGERLDGIGWSAMVGSTTGAALIALSGRAAHNRGGATLEGDLLVVASCWIALLWILLNKRLMERNSHRVVTAYGLAVGTAMLVVWVLLRDGLPPVAGISWKAWAALAASGVLCTATTTLLWNWGLTQVPASQAGVLLNVEPLMGSLLGVLVLGERLGPSAWVGGAMILAAAGVLTGRREQVLAVGG